MNYSTRDAGYALHIFSRALKKRHHRGDAASAEPEVNEVELTKAVPACVQRVHTLSCIYPAAPPLALTRRRSASCTLMYVAWKRRNSLKSIRPD